MFLVLINFALQGPGSSHIPARAHVWFMDVRGIKLNTAVWHFCCGIFRCQMAKGPLFPNPVFASIKK